MDFGPVYGTKQLVTPWASYLSVKNLKTLIFTQYFGIYKAFWSMRKYLIVIANLEGSFNSLQSTNEKTETQKVILSY